MGEAFELRPTEPAPQEDFKLNRGQVAELGCLCALPLSSQIVCSIVWILAKETIDLCQKHGNLVVCAESSPNGRIHCWIHMPGSPGVEGHPPEAQMIPVQALSPVA